MADPAKTIDQNILPVQALFNLDNTFNTFIGQGQPFYATVNPIQSGLHITNSTIDSTTIGATTPSSAVFTNMLTNTGQVSSAPIGPTDLTNKYYVDALALGLGYKNPVVAATTVDIPTLSGLLTVDGVTLTAGQRVLVKNQTLSQYNGIYTASLGTWSRSPDADTYDKLVAAVVFVEDGGQAGTGWFCSSPAGGTLNVTPITWNSLAFSAPYSAGTGLTLTGTTFSITNTGVTANAYGSASSVPTFTVNAQGQLTLASNTSIAISNTQVSGLGTLSTQNANSVSITGGSINGTSIGGSSPSTGAFTTLDGTTITASTEFSGPGTGLTGTASTLNIGGNAATATYATSAGSSTTATTATNLAGGSTNAIPYQTAPNLTSFLASSSGVLQNNSGLAWTTTPTLTGTNFSGIPNSALVYSSFTLGSTSISLGSTTTSVSGLSLASASFVSPTNFVPTTAPTYAEGNVWFDSTYNGLAYQTDVSGVTIYPGQEVATEVYNDTGSTIPAGSVVYVTGQHSKQPTIALAQANSLSTANALGIVQTSIADNNYGWITVLGELDNLNTSSFTAGDTLYLSATTPGAITNVAPTSPNYAIRVGFCLYSNPSQGNIFVSVRNAYVATNNIVGQVPLANGGTNANLTASAGGIVYSTASAFGISSVGTTGQVLTSNGASAPTWSTPVSYSTVTDDTTTNATRYPLFANQTSGSLSTEYVSSTKYQFNPSTGILTATGFSGSGSGLTSLDANQLTGTIPSAVLGNSTVYIGTTAILLNRASGSQTLTGTSIDGNAATATTATTATNATNIAITDNVASSATWYPVLSANSSGNNPATTSSTQISFVPSTGKITLAGDASISTLTVGKGVGAVSSNTALGANALAGANTGSGANVAVGYQALNANTSGNSNTAIGFAALLLNTTTTRNTAVGTSALGNNIQSYCTAVGFNSGYSNTTGNITAFGHQTLYSNTTGSRNVAIGGFDGSATSSPLYYNTTGNFNTGVGYNTLFQNTIGSNNTAIGNAALQNNTTAVATLGAISNGGTGYNGGASGGPLTVQASLSSGTAAGTYPTLSITVTSGVITAATLVTNGTRFVDTTTVLTVTSAAMVTAGFASGGSGFTIPVATLASGGNNTAVGYQALNANINGNSNSSLGDSSLLSNTTGFNNTATGVNALRTTTTGSTNTASGRDALYSNLTGNSNSGFGANSLRTSTGDSNTAVGQAAGYYISSGTQNVCLGVNSAASGTNNLTTGSNNIIIGYNAAASSATISNEITLGNTSITSMRVPGIAATFGTDNSTISTLTVGKGGGAVSSNTALGASALLSNSTGGQNTAVGSSVLQSNTTGNQNSGLGFQALLYNVSGGQNSAFGMYALNYNSIGSSNSAFGYQALYRNTTAVATLGAITGGSSYTNGTYTGVVMTLSSGSTAVTYPTATIVVSGGAVTTVTITSPGAGFKDTTTVLTAPAASIGGTGSGFSVPVATLATGGSNTAVGYQALNANTTASNNVATGYRALASNTTGNNNSSFGYASLQSNTTGGSNNGYGYFTLQANTTGVNNVAIGNNALTNNTTANANAAVGVSALQSNVTGISNTAVGFGSLQNSGKSVTAGSFVVGVSYTILTIGTTDFTLIGAASNTIGLTFTATGAGTGTGTAASNTNNNTAVGYNALNANTTGTPNTAFGYQALASNLTGNQNVAVGDSALFASTGTDNVAIGSSSLVGVTSGGNNIGIGTTSCQRLTTNSFVTAIGRSSARFFTGQQNTAIGYQALLGVDGSSTGSNNTAIGTQAGAAITTGTQNTLIGNTAGNSGTNNLTTGSNNIIIGYNAAASSATVSNEVTIGNDSVTATRLKGNVRVAAPAASTTMTDGFFYIPAAAGAPSGVPTAVTGTVPMYYDTTNNKFYIYNGAWKSVTLA